ncbi:hypothetical protein ABKN59_001357 [Abortiporus biennis]
MLSDVAHLLTFALWTMRTTNVVPYIWYPEDGERVRSTGLQKGLLICNANHLERPLILRLGNRAELLRNTGLFTLHRLSLPSGPLHSQLNKVLIPSKLIQSARLSYPQLEGGRRGADSQSLSFNAICIAEHLSPTFSRPLLGKRSFLPLLLLSPVDI